MILSSIGIITSKAAAAVAGIVTDGLMVSLEASVYTSGSATWLDQSGNGRNFTKNTNMVHTSAGLQSYFILDGVDDAFIGPASNALGIADTTGYHTIEIGLSSTANANGKNPYSIATTTSPENGIHTHIPEGQILYDLNLNSSSPYNGLRVGYTASTGLPFANASYSFQKSGTALPSYGYYVQMFQNAVSKLPLAGNATTNVNMGTFATNPMQLGSRNNSGYHPGNLYYFRIYNRALTQAEIDQNFAIDRIKLGI
jgi:hypothetical protein